MKSTNIVSRVVHSQDPYLFVDIKRVSGKFPYLNPISGNSWPTESLARQEAAEGLENKYQSLVSKFS